MTAESAVTARELAALLNVSVSTVYAKATTGEFPAFKVGRLWRFWPSMVQAELERPRSSWSRSPQARTALFREARKRIHQCRPDPGDAQLVDRYLAGDGA